MIEDDDDPLTKKDWFEFFALVCLVIFCSAIGAMVSSATGVVAVGWAAGSIVGFIYFSYKIKSKNNERNS